MRKITDNVYIFPFFGSFLNIYLVETPEGLLLVDTGIGGGQMDRVASDLAKSGRSISDLKHIFITHAHTDHIGGLPHLQKLVPVTVPTYAHRREAMIIRGEAKPIYARPEDLKGVSRFMSRTMANAPLPLGRADREVKDGDMIAGMLQVIEFPGHAYGQCGLWWAEKRLLIGGDVMSRLPWGMVRPLPAATPDMKLAEQSIKRVVEMNVEILCLGHGAPLIGDASQKVQKFAARFDA